MISQLLLQRSIRAALYGATIAGLTAAPSLHAQDKSAEGGDKTKKLETMTVLGSRIKRVDVETSQPVFVIEKADLQRTGLSNVGDVLTQLVYADNGAVTTVTNNTNGNNGSVNISLRNLGPTRVLVLVNGRRFVTDLFGQTDFQTIPLAIVERIEVLKDGASAIYGSDAIAGVINIVTRKSYDGMEANSYLGENEKGDGRTESYDFTIGGSTDRASLIANFAYSKQEKILAGDRAISAEPQFGGGLVFGSSSSERGRFCLASSAVCNAAARITLIPGRSGASATDFARFNPAVDSYNFAPITYLQQPFDRYSTYVQGRYAITDNINFNTQATYIKRRGRQQLAETPLILATSGVNGPQWAFPVSAGNVFNPFGVDVKEANFRMRALGPRQNNFDFDTWAFSGGFDGNFELGDRSFAWDTTYQYLDSNYGTSGAHYVNLFNLRNALGPSFRDGNGVLRCGTPGAVIAGCVPFNLFGGPDLGVGAGRQTAAEAATSLDYVGYTLVNDRDVSVINYSANLTGDIVELPAGPLGFAAGYEYRKTSGRFTPDALVAEGGSSNNFTEPTSGQESVQEYYLEVNAPIVKDLPFAQVLELNAAIRYSDFSAHGLIGINPVDADQIGNTTNSKFGFKWKPITDLLVRGSWAETFRAPQVGDLFAGGGEGFPQAIDPCASSGPFGNRYAALSQAARDRCTAQGVPLTGAPQSNAQIRALAGGNPGLAPEHGTTRTLGLVYSPSYLEGFDVALDWYRIKLTDGLSAFSANAIITGCITGGVDVFCNFISRVPGGEAALIRTSQFNASSLENEGYDIGLNYKLDTDWGKFRWAWNTAYTTNADFQGNNFTGELVGDAAVWRIRSQLATTWSYGDWDVTWLVRYQSGLDEDGGCVGFEGFQHCDANGTTQIPSFTYNDVQVGWNTPWNGHVTAGLRNAFDKQPPVSFNTFANSFPQGYDIPGRFWYVSYHQKF